jgi:hypothetical protein
LVQVLGLAAYKTLIQNEAATAAAAVHAGSPSAALVAFDAPPPPTRWSWPPHLIRGGGAGVDTIEAALKCARCRGRAKAQAIASGACRTPGPASGRGHRLRSPSAPRPRSWSCSTADRRDGGTLTLLVRLSSTRYDRAQGRRQPSFAVHVAVSIDPGTHVPAAGELAQADGGSGGRHPPTARVVFCQRHEPGAGDTNGVGDVSPATRSPTQRPG